VDARAHQLPAQHRRARRAGDSFAGEISTVAGGFVPGTFNYRLPLNPLRWSRAIDELAPISSKLAMRSILRGPRPASRIAAVFR